jgi:spoIIIJ-associated protein
VSTGADRVRELLEHVVSALELDATIEVTEDDEMITGGLSGEELGLFIGRHGATIDAVQHIAYRLASDAGDRKRVTIDASGYRERRAAVLRHDAGEAADDAVRLARPVRLEPMSASERRVVHEFLRERGDVDTHSEGEEPDRRLVVEPLEPE